MGVVRLGFALSAALLLLLFGGPAAPARADYEATEARLKSAGIDDSLRKEIHAAIDKGVEWLLAKQLRDDGFRDGGLRKGPSSVGYTALCALALRHAGTARAMSGLEKARKFLLEDELHFAEAASTTYAAGLTTMLVMADGGPRARAEALARALVEGQTESGSWGYGRSLQPVEGYPYSNLSTAQFGALGLWAAECARARIPIEAWIRVARQQVEHHIGGRWGYQADSDGGLPGYPQGTFMGLANLLLAEAALRRHEAPPAELLETVAAVRAKSMDALAEDVPRFLAKFGKYATGKNAFRDGFVTSPFYSLYALEKVCIFANVEKIGGVSWYRTGARHLLRCQATDGGWTPHHAISASVENRYTATAFALLFLLRASEAYHPVTPRPVDGPQEPRPRGDVTPSKDGDAEEPEDAPKPDPKADPNPDVRKPPIPVPIPPPPRDR